MPRESITMARRGGVEEIDMAEQPDDLVLRFLREMRADISSIRQTVEGHAQRFDRLEKRLDDLAKIVKYTLGQANETQFRQAEQESRIDQLFEQLEKLLKPKEPA
jgi:septal ring factor EnvC (AmiA/AmiB activator)